MTDAVANSENETDVFENPAGFDVIIDELKTHLQEQYDSVTVIKSSANSVFSAASLVVAIIGALGLFNVKIEDDYQLAFNLLIGVAITLYVGMIIGLVWVLQPVTVNGPTKTTWETLWNAYASKEDELNIKRQQISNYLAAIEHNSVVIKRLSTRTKIFSSIFPVILIILLVLTLFPRTSIC